ncbi:hypothetical protein G7046_g4854 [Stylonectria norvegica]|nr:hypothetical protein G7046_g4854 [Stylonectria norvegica]
MAADGDGADAITQAVTMLENEEAPQRNHTACSPGTQNEPIKFDIPFDCRVFFPFRRLPPEIRHQIWDTTVTTPGMHFLKVHSQTAGFSWRWWTRNWTVSHAQGDSENDDEVDEIAVEVADEIRPSRTHAAKLVPLYPTPEADISYHTTINKQLARLSVTCSEASLRAQSLISRPEVLQLDGGRIISLDSSTDVIYLEYVPADVFEYGCHFTRTLECSGLDRIRRVAVRYCHKWYEQHSPRRCPTCGQIHQTPDRITYPNHLYQFMAQYLPNLEHFYFVDYFILRKPTNLGDEEGQGDGEPPARMRRNKNACKFQGGNRCYYEVDSEDWNVKSKVFEMQSWLQNRFVRYAKASKLSQHKAPEKVNFSVLACEWAVGPPTVITKGPATPVKKGRNKRAFCEEHAIRRTRRISARQALSPTMSTSKTTTTDKSHVQMKEWFPFIFGVPGSNSFEFTFALPLR